MQLFDLFFYIGALVFSIVIHEVMHGVAADWLGDKTARYAGRLTLNPIPHIDLWGSIIIPLTLVYTGSPILLGWAKPVPYNPFNLRPGRFSEAIVAFAGPLSNLCIALFVALILHFSLVSQAMVPLLYSVVGLNIMLFCFNLLPIPPLDGSKILAALLPKSLARGYDDWRARMETNPFIAMLLVFFVVFVFGSQLGSFVHAVSRLLVGL